jgi:hypothetical protein
MRTLRPLTTSVLLVTALVVAPSAARAQYDCPHEWWDAGAPIHDPQPVAPAGVPEAEIDALHAFATSAGISSLAGLLGSLPSWILANHVLLDGTRTAHHASVEHPRALLFGSDARFLMAFSSDPDDPSREVIDLAELEDTGFWKFRSIDFRTSPPTLSPDDSACTGCHADPPRPFWGSYSSWPGAFGPQQDRVTAAQAERLNELRADPSASDRFFGLGIPAPFGGGAWEEGDVVRLPGRSYAYSNTVFNMELGAAVADGAFRRLRASPRFRDLRDELLTLSYCAPRDALAYASSGARDAVPATLLSLGVAPAAADPLYRHLGVDPDLTFSLHRLASEPPDPKWNVSTDTLVGLVNLLLLHDWMREDPELLRLLEAEPDPPSPFNAGCFEHVADLIRYKVYLGFSLRGAARQTSRAAGMDVDLLRATQGVLDPVRGELCPFLYERVQSTTPASVPACSDGVDNDGDGLADFPLDPGCRGLGSRVEDPACDDRMDEDHDGRIDLADPDCEGPYGFTEAPRPPGCGLGPELTLALSGLWWLRRRHVAQHFPHVAADGAPASVRCSRRGGSAPTRAKP